MKCLIFIALVLTLAGCGKPASEQLSDRAQKLVEQCASQTVGFRRVVKSHIDITGAETNWSATATVEFINKVGGVEQKEVPFVFYVVIGKKLPDALVCSLDYIKIAAQEEREHQARMEQARHPQ